MYRKSLEIGWRSVYWSSTVRYKVRYYYNKRASRFAIGGQVSRGGQSLTGLAAPCGVDRHQRLRIVGMGEWDTAGDG